MKFLFIEKSRQVFATYRKFQVMSNTDSFLLENVDESNEFSGLNFVREGVHEKVASWEMYYSARATKNIGSPEETHLLFNHVREMLAL